MSTTTGRGLAVTSPKLIFTDDGKYCYAYSGLYATNTTAFEVLSFDTKLKYIVGKMQLNGGVDDDNPADSTINTANIQFNGVTVGTHKSRHSH